MKFFFNSIHNALRGLFLIARGQPNFRFHLSAAIVVLLLAWALHLGSIRVALLLLVITGVLVLECLNTIFERMIDGFSPRFSALARELKDMMAGGVLLGSLVAVLMGLILLGPPIFSLLSLLVSSW